MRRRNTQFKTFKSCLASMKKEKKPAKVKLFQDKDFALTSDLLYHSIKTLTKTFDLIPQPIMAFYRGGQLSIINIDTGYEEFVGKKFLSDTTNLPEGMRIDKDGNLYQFVDRTAEQNKRGDLGEFFFNSEKAKYNLTGSWGGEIRQLLDGKGYKFRLDYTQDGKTLYKIERTFKNRVQGLDILDDFIDRILQSLKTEKQPRTREKFTDADCVRLLNKETRKLGGIKTLGSLFPPNADVTYTDLSKALVAIRTLSNSWSGAGVSQPIQRGLKDLNYAIGVLYSEDTKKADEFAQWFLCELHDAYVKAKDTQIGKQGSLITRGIGKPVAYWRETEDLLKKWVPKFEGSFKSETHISERGGVEEADLSIDPDTDFAKQDIGYRLAYDAHRWNSFSPERRAKQYLGMYNQTLKQALTEFQSAARSQGFGNEDAVAQFETFRKGLAKRYRDVLSAKSRAPSSMVTGPARFPVKKADAAWKRYRELFTDLAEYESSAYKIAMKRFKKEKIKALGGIQKLRQQEASTLQDQLDRMVAINKIAKSRKADSTKLKELSDIGVSGEDAKIYITPDSYGEVGIPSYTIANLRGRIKGRSETIERQDRKERIGELAEQTIFDFPDGQIEYNFEEDRIQIRFGSYNEDGDFVTEKPSKEELAALKQKGLSSFRFARTQNNAWQQNLTDRWIAATRRITGVDIPSLSSLERKGQQIATKDMTPEEKLKDIALEAKRVITEDAKRPDKITISDYGKVSGLHYSQGELSKIEKDGFEIVLKWGKKPYKRDITRIEKAIMRKIRERDREAVELISGGAWFPNETMITWKMEYPKEEKKPTKKRKPKADLPKITGDQFIKRIESIIKGHWPMSYFSVRIPKRGYLGSGNVEIDFTLGSGKEQWPNGYADNDPIRVRIPIRSSQYSAGAVDDKGNIRSGDLTIEAHGAKRLRGSGWAENLSWRNAKKQNYEQIYKKLDAYFGKTLKEAVIRNKDRLPYTNLKKSNPLYRF